MFFLILLIVFTALQALHRRFLLRLLPKAAHRWVTLVLVLVHVPLVMYMLTRMVGHGVAWAWLRPAARLGLLFQMLTLFNLALWGLAEALWRLKPGKAAEPADPARRRFLRQTAGLGAGLAAVGLVVGRAEAHAEPTVERLEVAFPDLPQGLDGLRLVQLSDLHAGPLVHRDLLDQWRRAAERERPDLLVITGDLVDSLPEEIGPLRDAFRDFPAPLGRYAILGNHDYFTDPVPIWAGLEAAGFTLLENRWAPIQRNGATLALIGLQDPMARHGLYRELRFGPGPLPEQASKGIPEGAWRLCLNHRPNEWPLAKRTGAALTLSGHTHGGQINPVPFLSSARLLGPYTAGLYREGAQALYVSRGLGVVALPMRLGAPPEVTVITLRRS